MTQVDHGKLFRPNQTKKCSCCKKVFKINPRLGDRQKTCGEVACKKQHRSQYRRKYRKENEEVEREYQSKRKASLGSSYWREYRESHPEYAERNRRFSRLRKRLVKAGLQRQLDIAELIEFPNKLNSVTEFATSYRSLFDEDLFTKCG